MSQHHHSTRQSKANVTTFFEAGRALDAAGDPEANCWLCKGRIDYLVPANTTPDSHNRDHYRPVSIHPELEEDPDNWRHSHALCNTQRSNGTPQAGGLGESVADWW